MGVLDKLGGFLGGGLGGKIADLVGSRMENKAEAAKLAQEITLAVGQRAHEVEMALIDLEKSVVAGQTDINKIEAGSDSIFRSGWRPAVGWSCVAGLLYQLLLQPILAWVSGINDWTSPPMLAFDTLLTLLFGILGLGAYRTYEKVQR